jgi:circadian clock protein KaiC
MTTNAYKHEKLASGIRAFDYLSDGGLPKAIEPCSQVPQVAARHCIAYSFCAMTSYNSRGMDGVLVTLEERPKDLIANVRNLGWDLEHQIEERSLLLVDACADSHEYMIVSGDFDLSVLVSRVKHAVRKVQAKGCHQGGSAIFVVCI